jgi:hypothetical protein
MAYLGPLRDSRCSAFRIRMIEKLQAGGDNIVAKRPEVRHDSNVNPSAQQLGERVGDDFDGSRSRCVITG